MTRCHGEADGRSRRQDNASQDFAPFEPLMGGGCLRKRQHFMDAWVYHTCRHKRHRSLELRACRAYGTSDLEPPAIDHSQVKVDSYPCHLAQQDDSATQCHRAAGLVEDGAPDGIDGSVGASGEDFSDLATKCSVLRHNDFFSPCFAQGACFGLRAGDCDHSGAECVCDLHGVKAKSSSAYNDDVFARAHTSDLTYCVVGCGNSARRDSRGVEVHGRRKRHEVVISDEHQLCVAAGYVMSEETKVGTQRLASCAAQRAAAAHRSALRGAHSIAQREAHGVRTQCYDMSSNFMSEDERQSDSAAQWTTARPAIPSAHPACRDANQHLIGDGRRFGHFV